MRLAAALERLRVWPVVALLACWVPLAINFGPALASDRIFALRDGVHYYPQLLQVIHRQWPEQLPLWNPLEERGRPLWADPTAAVLYPGQLIFALPCPFNTLYKLYIVGHLLLCAINSLVAARRLRLGWHSAALVSVSYTLGGSIVFQYCNLPYLIGAAWLPLGAASVLGVIYGRRRAIIELTAVLVLLVLGGDPQSAYLLGATSLLAAGLAVAPLRRELGWRATWRPLAQTVVRLALAGVLAIGISAAQWIPTLAWVRASERVETGSRNAGALAASSSTEHDRARAEFSIGPWRWAELLWPNVTGRLFPRNERWIRAIPAEGRTWSPSLYMGILPLMLACHALRLRGGRLAERWLTCLVLLGVLGSLGRYGIAWLWSELSLAWDAPGRSPDDVGGLYWLLTIVLPGFGLFRYPAKLWTWAALGLSLLAGIRLQDATAQQRLPIPRRWLALYCIVTLVLLLMLIALRPQILARLAAAPPDALFGPLVADSAYAHLIISLIHGLCVVAAAAFLGRAIRARSVARDTAASQATVWRDSTPWAWAIVVVTAIELALAGRWMVATVPASAAAAPGISPAELKAEDGFPPLLARFRSGMWYPPAWAVTSNDQRLTESVVWDSLTARPKYPIAHGLATLQGSTSFSSREQRALLALIDDLSLAESSDLDSGRNFSDVLGQLGVNFVCVPDDRGDDGLAPVVDDRPMRSAGNDARWKRVPDPIPQVWIVHEAVVAPPPPSDSIPDLKEYLRDVFLPGGQARDLRRQVVLTQMDAGGDSASDAARETPPLIQRAGGPVVVPESDCRAVLLSKSELRVRAVLRRPGWLLVNGNYDPAWRAVVRTGDSERTLRTMRANYVMRAIPLPAGEHDVRLRYDPPSVRLGIWLSAISLVGAGLAAVCRRVARTRAQALQRGMIDASHQMR